MEKIIDKAIANGYDVTGKMGFPNKAFFPMVVCDPKFWQVLEKGCGWEEKWEKETYHGHEVFSAWLHHAIRFHEINLTAGFDKAVEYLQEITTK